MSFNSIEPIAWLKDVGSAEDPCFVQCAKGDDGGFPVYAALSPKPDESGEVRAATIEECARVAETCAVKRDWATEIASAIRALSPKPGETIGEALDAATIEACAKVCQSEADSVADRNADRYWQSKRIEGSIRKLAALPPKGKAEGVKALQWCVSVCDHAIEHYKGPVARKIRREVAVELARRSALTPISGEGAEANLFWDDENPEESFTSIEDLVDYIGVRSLAMKVRMAKSLPDTWVSAVYGEDDSLAVTYHASHDEAFAELNRALATQPTTQPEGEK